MAGTNVLREFVVRLGFKVDDQQFRNFNEGMLRIAKGSAELAKNFVALGEASALSMSAVVAAITAAAKPLESLYFASHRTGASAKELQTFSFAAEQVGVSAENAQAAIEGLAAARRTNPGLNGILAGMGIDPRQTDNAKVMVELLTKLSAMPHYQGAQIGSMFGISEQMLNQIQQNGPEFVKMMQLRETMFAKAGIDPAEYAKRSHEFMVQLRELGGATLDLSEIMAYRLMPAGEKVLGWLEGVVDWLNKADKATDGWSSGVLALASTLTGLSVARTGLGVVGGLLGAGGGGGGLGAALGGAATTGLLGVGIGAAAIASNQKTAEFYNDQMGKWMSSLMNSMGISDAQQGAWGQKIIDLQDKWTKSTTSSDMLRNLSRMIIAHEGIRKRVYRDVAGLATIGVGHLIMPGEDFSKGLDDKGVASLLIKDIGSALATVRRLVKVHLNDNQTAALADFVFNMGGGKLASSTLLKKLNSGDFAGAADQFQYWNHALVNGHMATVSHLSEIRAQEASMFRGGTPVTITQKTDIHVDGGEARNTAREVARQQGRVNGDLVRNFIGATQ